MTQINNSVPKATTKPVNGGEIKKENKSSLYMLTDNPVTDAVAIGTLGAAGGAVASYVMQNKVLKNDTSRLENITKLTKDIANNTYSKVDVKSFEHELKCLQNKKINTKSMGKWAVGIGLFTFVPQLIVNGCIWAGKKGYDAIKKTDK